MYPESAKSFAKCFDLLRNNKFGTPDYYRVVVSAEVEVVTVKLMGSSYHNYRA